MLNRRSLLTALAASPLGFLFRTPVSDPEPVTKFATVEEEDLLWGTYGKNGDQPLRWVRLGDCETAHLEAILRTQNPQPLYSVAICHILQDRGVDGWELFFEGGDKQLTLDGYYAAPEREHFRLT